MKIKLPPFIETFIVKFALSKSGPFIQKGVALLAAYLVAFFADKVPGLEAHLNVTVITGILWAVIDNLMSLIPSEIIKRYGIEIQTAFKQAGQPVKIDGLVLSKTADAAAMLAAAKKTASKNTEPTKVASWKNKNNLSYRPKNSARVLSKNQKV